MCMPRIILMIQKEILRLWSLYLKKGERGKEKGSESASERVRGREKDFSPGGGGEVLGRIISLHLI